MHDYARVVMLAALEPRPPSPPDIRRGEPWKGVAELEERKQILYQALHHLVYYV